MFLKTIKFKKIYLISFIITLIILFLLILLYETVFADDKTSSKDNDYIKWIDFTATEQILLDTLEGEYKFPIIKSNNFGHIDKKTVIPIGIKARISTNEKIKIKFLEKCVD